MPGGDRTGPSGFGPGTGRAAGYYARYPALKIQAEYLEDAMNSIKKRIQELGG